MPSSRTFEDILPIHHKNINCRSCRKYTKCKSIEFRFRNKLRELDGNWRALFDNGRRLGTPIRRCSHAIVEEHRDKFRNKQVLEIGCGPSSEIDYEFCLHNNIQYMGIDPKRLPFHFIPHIRGKSIQYKIVIFLLNLFKIKKWPKRNKYQRYILDYFPSKMLESFSFDLIYGNSTIEHWREDDDDVDRSLKLYQGDIVHCYNLLRPGGKLLINCPIHVHGNPIFVRGRVDLIERFFADKWKSVVFEHWRESFDDLMPYCPKHRKKPFKEIYHIDLVNIWILNIVATK